MMKRLLLLPFLACIAFSADAQSDCNGTRYRNEIFQDTLTHKDVAYGANVTLNGTNQTLLMDVYEPAGDTEPLRPALVWIHGGSFITGTKTGPDVVPLCEAFSRMGYVNVSVEYRLGMNLFGPDSVDGTECVVRAVHDAKAAVRYLYMQAQTGNAYRIDTNRIIIAGVSAGAITAVHYGYLDKLSEWPNWVDTTKAGLGGGIEGESGNAGYSSRVIGVVNVAGALARKEWLEAGSLPIVSLHGDQDDVVPYGSDIIKMLGIYPIMMVHGSSAVHAEAQAKGVPSCFFTYKDQLHVPHVGNAAYTDTTVNIIRNYIYGWTCSTTSTCGYIPAVAVDDPSMNAANIAVYPNPAYQSVQIAFRESVPADYSLELLDLTGRIVYRSAVLTGNAAEMDVQQFARGLYMLRIQASGSSYTTRVSLQ